MTQKEKNYAAFIDFIQSRDGVKDNGNSWWFNGNVHYTNKKTHNIYSANGGNIHAGLSYQYGGVVMHADELQAVDDVFVEWSSNFGIWKYSNGVLTISGTDITGLKGDYVVSIS